MVAAASGGTDDFMPWGSSTLTYVSLFSRRNCSVHSGLLASHAMKYTLPDGKVHVSLRNSATEARVSVADTGAGIPSADLPHIFERFYRVDKSRTRATGGSGLGLTIAKRLAEAHGGRIEVESAVGQGSTFTVVLPHKAPPPASPLPTTGANPVPAT